MRTPRLLHDETVEILAATGTGVDEDGVPTTTTERHPWPGVNVQRVTAEELTDQGRNTTITTYRVSGPPPKYPVTAGDEIEWRGQTYRVDAEPDTRTGRARVNYTALNMVRAEG